MKLSRSIIIDLSLVAAVSTLFIGTARADDTLTPTFSPTSSSTSSSDYPSSWYPSSFTSSSDYPSSWYPSWVTSSDYEYDPNEGCPDRHSSIVSELYRAFGQSNCNDGTEGVLECEYIDENWVRGWALYQFTDSDGGYHYDYRPESITISETILYGPSGIVFIFFTEPQSPSFSGSCLDGEGSAFLSGIGTKRLFPGQAPTCDDTEGEFEVTIGGQTRTATCDDLWNRSLRIRNRACDNIDDVASFCPGVCSKFDDFEFGYPSNLLCKCKNNPLPFAREDFVCADLDGLDGDALSEKCDLRSYLRNCPRDCDDSCASGF